MTRAIATTHTELLADLIAEAIRANQGAVGVLVRDVPAPDPHRMLSSLLTLREELGDLRVAYLREGGKEAAEDLGVPEEIFFHQVEQAERWRNDPDLKALIVVIAHGDEPKLSSLEDFAPITSRDLKKILVGHALGEEAGENEVQTGWWGLLAADEAVGLGQLIDYYLALAGKTGGDFLDASSREIYRLGLLPDPELFNNPKDHMVRNRLQANRDLISRLQTLTPRDRRTITRVLSEEKDLETKKRLREALDQLDRVRWEGEGLQAITFDAAERLVKARAKKPPKDGKPPPTAEKAAVVAAEGLVNEDRAEDVSAIVEGLQKQLNELDESRLRPQTVKVTLPDAGTDAVATARLDTINVLSKLLDDGTYGGLIEVEAPDLESALRRFDAQQHLIARWERERLAEFLVHLSVDDAGADLRQCFASYEKERAAVLPYLRTLAVEPLVVAANPATRAHLLALISAYEALNQTARDRYDQLFERFGADAHEVLGHLLLLETAIVRTNGRTYAIAAPTHTLFLWHYARYCQIVDAQRDRLEERDRGLVAQAAANLPNFLTSLFIPPTAFGTPMVLPYVGRLGPLPYFGEKVEASAADDSIGPIRALIEAHVALEPPTRLGFRLALVDPPDAGVYLSAIADLAEERALEGAHVTVYRRPRSKRGVELRLDEAEEERIARVFRAITTERRFTFEIRELPEHDVGPPEDSLHHLVVIFDRSGGQPNRARPALHPIQPLALPRRIHYSQIHKTVELEPAPGGPFGSYDKLVSRLSHGGSASYLSVHQNAQLRAALQGIASRTPWTAVADRQVDRDLALGALRIATSREGERDVAGFSRSTVAFRRPLRDVVRNYNAHISETELDDLLRQLSDLLDAGLLNLRPDVTGKTYHNRIKGLLGTLIAARWYRQTTPANDRLLISLDSGDARRWMHLSDDPLQADLVGFEWSNDHCTVSVMEVKAVQSPSSEYTVTEGIVDGPAIRQMLSTRRLLEMIFGADREHELITTPARREILREHLYRELTKGTYLAEERKLWADRLQRLLDGSVTVDLRCHLVDVRLGVDTATLKSRSAAAHDGDATIPVQITELNERQIPALVPPEVPEVPPESPPKEPKGPREKPPAEAAEEAPEILEEAPKPSVEVEGPEVVSSLPEPAPERARALLGAAPGAYGKPRDVWFDPSLPEERLPNPHIGITGETGSGKTQATKAIIADLQGHDVPALILDFKDDYSEPAYADREGLTVYDPTYQSLPFNPLAPPIDLRTGQANTNFHTHQITDIIKRIYGLGDQQAYRLREAIKSVYEHAGVPTTPFIPTAGQTFPPFEDVRAQLALDKENNALLGRMSPIFDLGLFSSGQAEAGFASVVASSTVVRLGQLPGNETKNSVAEFFLMALYNHLVRQPQMHALARLLVLDEAWRLVQSPFIEPLMREGRAFGLGVLIATQFPADLPSAISGSTATKLFFSQTDLTQIREIQRIVVGKASGPEADHLAGVLRGLSPLTCVLHSKQYAPFVRVTIKPYFERRGQGG